MSPRLLINIVLLVALLVPAAVIPTCTCAGTQSCACENCEAQCCRIPADASPSCCQHHQPVDETDLISTSEDVDGDCPCEITLAHDLWWAPKPADPLLLALPDVPSIFTAVTPVDRQVLCSFSLPPPHNQRQAQLCVWLK